MLQNTMERSEGDLDFPGIYNGRRVEKKISSDGNVKWGTNNSFTFSYYTIPERVVMTLGGAIKYGLSLGIVGGFLFGVFDLAGGNFSEIPYSALSGAMSGGTIGGLSAIVTRNLPTLKATQTNLYSGFIHSELPQAEDYIRTAGVLAKAYEIDRKSKKEQEGYFDHFKQEFYNALKEEGIYIQGTLEGIDEKQLRVTATGHGIHFDNIRRAGILQDKYLGPETARTIWENVQRGIAEIEMELYRPDELTLINRAYSGTLF